MARIEGETVIRRPPEVVFDFVSDERNEPRYNPRMVRAEQISIGPIGNGTRFRAVTTSMGRNQEMVIEFVDVDRPTRLASATHLPSAEIKAALTFEPDPAGTRMRWQWEIRPRRFLRLLAPLIGWMGARQERAVWERLGHHLEALPDPRPGEPAGPT